MVIKIKRAYEKSDKSDGCRILVDNLWPRGVKKENADIDLWLRDIAPSKELREWFSHDPKKWNAFKRKYFMELNRKEDAVDKLEENIVKNKNITLIYSSRDKDKNNAKALKDYIDCLNA